MDDIKKTISANIAALRTNAKLTQAELAEKLGYSDKSVSKWERAESVPDIYVLKSISDIFDVTVDYILSPHQPDEKVATRKETARRNHRLITSISILGILLLATVAFTAVWSANGKALWLIYLDCLPLCLVVLLVLNSLWFERRNNQYIVSALLWSVLTAVYVSLLTAGTGNYWLIFIIGVPAQIVTILGFGIKRNGKLKSPK